MLGICAKIGFLVGGVLDKLLKNYKISLFLIVVGRISEMIHGNLSFFCMKFKAYNFWRHSNSSWET